MTPQRLPALRSADRAAPLTPEQAHQLAMAVKVLCDVRLACVVLLMIAAPSMGLGVDMVVVAGVALALSYVLLRHWEKAGARLLQGWWFPALESLVAILLFVRFGASGLGSAYLGVTLALLACAGGWRAMTLSLTAFFAIVVMAVAGIFPTLGGASARESIWLLSLVVLLVACSLAGFYLRAMVFSRVELVDRQRAAELAEASSQERLRLAHELHDGVSKTLHGCYMISDSLARQLDREEHEQAAKARQLARSLEVARQESRDLLYELRQLPAVDLVPFCRRAVAQWASENPAILVTTELCAGPVTVPVRTRHDVLRVLGELLENVRRHSGSPRVAIALARTGEGATLVVADEGNGLPDEAVSGVAQTQGHFGLAGVRERMELIQGSCRISTSPTGTRVEIGFPVIAEDEAGQERGEGE